MKQNLKATVLNTLYTLITAADKNHDKRLNDEEVDQMIQRLKKIEGIKNARNSISQTNHRRRKIPKSNYASVSRNFKRRGSRWRRTNFSIREFTYMTFNI